MGVEGAACICRSCPITVWTGAQGQAGLLKTFREVFAMRWYKLTPPLGSTGFSKSSFVCVNCCGGCKKHDRYSLKQKEQNFLAIFPSFYSKLKGSSAVSWGILLCIENPRPSSPPDGYKEETSESGRSTGFLHIWSLQPSEVLMLNFALKRQQ